MFFISIADELRNYIGPAFIALLLFLVLISSGIVSNSGRPFSSLIANGYFQLAIVELFLCTAGLAYYYHTINQAGHIIIRLQPEQIKDSIKLSMKYQSLYSSTIDTIIAPTELYRLSAGNYRFETLDTDIVHFHTDITLKPAGNEIINIPVALNRKKIAINSKPAGADILIDGVFISKTPDTLEIYNTNMVIIELRMPDYQSYIDTMALSEDVDLGTITLLKLYSLRILSYLEGMEYQITDVNNRIIFSANESKKMRLPEGNYKLSYEIGEGEIKTRHFSLSYNSTIEIP
jgi:hypothetical protein